MMTWIFTTSMIVELDRNVGDLKAQLGGLLSLTRETLFDEAMWHPEVEGGGMHWRWGRSDGDTRYHFGSRASTAGIKLVNDPVGWGGIDYASARAKVVAAFKPIQTGPAQRIVRQVQDFQERVYQVWQGPSLSLSPPPPPRKPRAAFEPRDCTASRMHVTSTRRHVNANAAADPHPPLRPPPFLLPITS